MMIKKINELREMPAADRRAFMMELLKERQNLRLRKGAEGGVKTHRFAQVRAMVAQIKTIETEEKAHVE